MLMLILWLALRRLAAPRYDLSLRLDREVYINIQEYGCVNVCML